MSIRRKLVIGVMLLAVCSFAGRAFAATRDSDLSSSQAFLNDVAKRLHVTPQQLISALQGAFADQLNAAVKAGKLTQAQANTIEQRARGRGFFPFGLLTPGGWFGFRHGPRGAFGLGHGPRGAFGLGHGPRGAFGVGHGPRLLGGGILGAAAQYLGLTSPQLIGELIDGKSLAQIAGSRGKSTSGLEAAIISGEQTRLDRLRSSGAITPEQERQLLSGLEQRIKALVTRPGVARPFGNPTLPPLAPPFRGTLGAPPAPTPAP